ncbi:MAG TPA: TetR/AcrR family transcriptional regulator [Actinomycetota bacterium]|jgi:AcrR family transcriptional regulator|nr:TetR/AcrR family transcriptional regulator [Actinomycetota bacterium]
MKERRLTKRGTKRREQVLEAAAQLFATQGYHGTTVGDVCDTLGVGKGVFYWYFESKESLFAELLESSLLRLRRAQQAAIDQTDDPVQRLEQGIRASIEFFRRHSEVLGLIRIAGRYEEFQGLVAKGQQVVVADTAGHIKEGMSQGRVRDGDPELMAHGILGAIFHFVEIYLELPEPTALRPGLDEEAVNFCLHGLLRR